MTYVINCHKCGQAFTKFSMKSTEGKCPDCRFGSRNVHVQLSNRRANEAAEVMQRLDTIEIDIANLANSVTALHNTIDTAVKASLEQVIEGAIDEHYATINRTLATVNSRAKQAFDAASEVRVKVMNMQKGSGIRNAPKKKDGIIKTLTNMNHERLMLELLDWLNERKLAKYNYFPRRLVINSSDSPWYRDRVKPMLATKLLMRMTEEGMLQDNGRKKNGKKYRLPRGSSV